MSSASSLRPDFDDTLRYSTRAPVFLSSWWKWIVWSRTAVYALTGTLTRPKLIEPLHVARGMPRRYPLAASMNRGGDTGGVNASAEELRIDRQARVQRIELGAELVGRTRAGVRARRRGRRSPSCTTHSTWEQTEVLRYDHYVPENRLGSGVRTDAYPLLRQTDLHLRSRFRVQFTGVAAILYRDGRDFQGLHSDREMKWLDDTLIAIAVLGARRPFVLRPRLERGVPVDRIPAGTAPDDVVLTPGEGDLLVMGGACQREWLHGVPAAPGVRSGADLADVAMDESARPAGHQPHVLRRSPLQRRPAPSRIAIATR